MKIIAEYDTISGNIIDSMGTKWLVGMNIPFEKFEEGTKQNLIQLIDAGLSADDLTKLKANGVI